MENNGSKQQDSLTLSPWRSLILLIIYFFIGYFVGQFVGVLLAMGLFGISWNQVLGLVSNLQSEPNAKYVMYCLQFATATGAFIVAPLFYLRRYENRLFTSFFNKSGWHIIPLLLTVVITLSFMVVNSILIEWNANITLPSGMERIEQAMQEQEAYLREVTEYLTTFNSPKDFIIAFLIIAIIPAIGEELFFRGLLQRKLGKIVSNPHVAIWLTAFLFSAFHFQFYGLFPRLFLGAIFGYLYYWSGSLLLPMLAHFINNGFSLIMYYLYQEGTVEFNVEEAEALPNTYIIVFLLLGIACFWIYRQHFRHYNSLPDHE